MNKEKVFLKNERENRNEILTATVKESEHTTVVRSNINLH